jgi:hypothetical protein
VNTRQGQGLAFLVPVLLPFVILATANSGGYRYGASDQAFYVPAMMRAADPALFPRDGALLDVQAHLMLMDEIIGGIARTLGMSFPVLLAIGYVVTLTLYAFGGARIGTLLYRERWTTIAFLAALTLRHAIARSGTNTLEGYFHPRQVAYALGVIAVGAFLERRYVAVTLLIVVMGAFHTTTAAWFAIWLGIAAAIHERSRLRLSAPRRLTLDAIVGLPLLALIVIALSGPLGGRLRPMDAEWLATLTAKDYLFPLEWPLVTWAINLAYIPVIVIVYRMRRAAGLLHEREQALVFGCLSLVILFFIALAFHTQRIALAIQLQPARIFWMLDFLAIAYAVWALGERRGVRAARAVALAVIAFSCVRGAYVLTIGNPERALAQVTVRDDDWGRVMAWARTMEPSSHWLADPMHAVLYGTSVRLAGERDVLVEAVKDTALGMYDRGVAMRTRDRIAAAGDFATMNAERARALAVQYDLDFLVTDRPLELPLAFQSGELRVYRLQ